MKRNIAYKRYKCVISCKRVHIKPFCANSVLFQQKKKLNTYFPSLELIRFTPQINETEKSANSLGLLSTLCICYIYDNEESIKGRGLPKSSSQEQK